jgi:hypothetical protein
VRITTSVSAAIRKSHQNAPAEGDTRSLEL